MRGLERTAILHVSTVGPRGRGRASVCCTTRSKENQIMLYWAIMFFIIAIVAGLFGFGGIASGAASIAQILFFLFVVLFLVSIVAYGIRSAAGGRPPV
jgi:uncharacterized membrane protein YtjA (UPF0391 family)